MGIVSGGVGGATYTPPITRAQYQAPAAPISLANNASVSLAWSFGVGTALLDLTTPTAPVVVTAGVYALSVEIVGTALTAGGYFAALIEMDTAGDDPQVACQSSIASAALANPAAFLGLTYYVPAGGGLSVQVTNKDGVAARSFGIAIAALQRLS